MNPYRAGFLQLVCVAPTAEQAKRDYAEHVEYFYNKCLHVWNGWADAPGYRTLRTLKAGVMAQVGAQARQIRQNLTWDSMVEQGYVVAGDPKQVQERLRDVVNGLRIGQLMVLCQIGSMPKELALRNINLIATEVMPYVHDIWSEYEDKWFPQPAARRVAVAAAGV